VGAGVHHGDAVSGAQQEFGVLGDTDAIVGNTVKQQDPGAVGLRRTNFPAVEEDAVGRADCEVFAARVSLLERDVGFVDEVGGERAANWMKIGWGDEPASDSGKKRRKKKKDECDAKKSALSGWAHGRMEEDTRDGGGKFGKLRAIAENKMA
jgi:hypothetical protein